MDQQDKDIRAVVKGMTVLLVASGLAILAFILALVAGILWLLRHFGVIHA